ncbi:MAG: hypothetical protein WCE68_08280 [Anaerolineales bacterium]
MPSSLQDAQNRVQRDLAEADRRQRLAAEKLARELAKVLQEVAILFDGDRLEALRRENPHIPQYWTPDDWRVFFAETPAPSVQVGWGRSDARSQDLERTIQELRARLAGMEAAASAPVVAETPAAPVKRLPREEAERVAKRNSSAGREEKPAAGPGKVTPVACNLPADLTPPLAGLFYLAQEAWKKLPDTCPAAFQKVLTGGGRTGADLKKVYKRYWLTIYLIGACGITAKLEIEDIISLANGLSSRPGSFGRFMDDMTASNILVEGSPRIGSPRTSLILFRLTPDGNRLFKIIFEKDPLESEWERLINLHEGERFPEHTLAVLVFALHARKRGWSTRILPLVEGTHAVPDLLVQRDEEKLYVEVELGRKESPAKWRNQAALNNGKVALCAATPATRQRLAGDCRLDHLSGVATDLDTLIHVKHDDISDQTPLWLESW